MSSGRKFETQHNGSDNKAQISSYQTPHDFYTQKNGTPLRRNACQFPLTKTRCLTKRNKFIAKNVQNRFLEPRDIGHDRWTLATLRFALGRPSADRVAMMTQIEKLRGVCPSRFVHARRPVQWPRQMGFSHIRNYRKILEIFKNM